MEGIIITLLMIAGGWFWWESRGAAERATVAAKRVCDTTDVYFLNDTVGWKKVRLKRNREGRIKVERTYFFEFSTDGDIRYQGEVEMLGLQTQRVGMDAYRAEMP